MSAQTAPRRPRKDVARNRERLLAAAETYFGERSLDAPLQGLAKAAGLGEATLFRHFPSHEALVRALYDRLVDRVEVVVTRAAGIEDPWLAVETFLRGSVELMIAHPALPEIMQRQAATDPSYVPGARWIVPIRGMVQRAVAAGVLRDDVKGSDLVTATQLFWGLARIPEPARTITAHRQLQVLLDGLRAGAATGSLPSTPLEVAEVHRVMHAVLEEHATGPGHQK